MSAVAWTRAKDEAEMQSRRTAFFAAIDRGMSDDLSCEVCHSSSIGSREVVQLHDDATLACPTCAALLKGGVAA